MKYWRIDYYRRHNWIDTKYIKDEYSQGAINKARVKNIVDQQEITEEEYRAGLARRKATALRQQERRQPTTATTTKQSTVKYYNKTTSELIRNN